MIYRTVKTKDYTTMSNYHFRDNQLSLKAKGLLSLMLSLPDEWKFTEKGIIGMCSDGSSSIKSAIKELKEKGYIVKNRERNNQGQFTQGVYDVYEKPLAENPTVEKPMLEKPIAENQILLNTNIINTNISNTKLLNTKINNTPYNPLKWKREFEDKFEKFWNGKESSKISLRSFGMNILDMIISKKQLNGLKKIILVMSY